MECAKCQLLEIVNDCVIDVVINYYNKMLWLIGLLMIILEFWRDKKLYMFLKDIWNYKIDKNQKGWRLKIICFIPNLIGIYGILSDLPKFPIET